MTADFVFGEVVVAAVACVLVRASARDRLLLGAEAARPGGRDEFLSGADAGLFLVFAECAWCAIYYGWENERERESER